jgi:hypothetical protein
MGIRGESEGHGDRRIRYRDPGGSSVDRGGYMWIIHGVEDQ